MAVWEAPSTVGWCRGAAAGMLPDVTGSRGGSTDGVADDAGPWYEDLAVGQVLDPAPAITLGPGEAATYQAVCGDPLATALSRPLAEAVTGRPGLLVNPALALQVSIGQSTVATRRVLANLFYRGVVLRRPVRHGETLATSVEVRGLRDLTRRPDRPARGLALLGIRTTCLDTGEAVVEYERCAMLRVRDATADTCHDDDLGGARADVDLDEWEDSIPEGWDPAPLRNPDRADDWVPGTTRHDPLRDTVTGATLLVRLTQNLAAVHRDPSATLDGRRLVYGGHTIGLAQASLNRLMPSNATILGWQACDHTGPVYEGDVLGFRHTLLDERPAAGGRMRAVRVEVEAGDPDEGRPVLDWSLVAWGA